LRSVRWYSANKRFTSAKLEALLTAIRGLEMKEQKERLEGALKAGKRIPSKEMMYWLRVFAARPKKW
jgi:hypothetical protein